MDQFETKRHYQPWVGASYESPTRWAGKRVLLVGDSHYEDDKPMAMPGYIEQFINGDDRGKGWRFWRNVMWLVDGVPDHQEGDRTGFWNDVAVTNFVQATMADNSEKVTKDQIRQSMPAFQQTLDELRPTHVLIMSTAVWNVISEGFVKSEKLYLPFDGGAPHEHETILMRAGEHQVRVSTTYHPNVARMNDPGYWQEVVRRFLALAPVA